MRSDRSPVLLAGVFLCTAAVFWADLSTPLGIAVWIFYLAPIALTLFGRSAVLPLTAAAVQTILIVTGYFISPSGDVPWDVVRLNRGFGIATLWLTAFIVRRFIAGAQRLEEQDWIREGQTGLAPLLWGEQELTALGDAALAYVCRYVDAAAGALFVRDNGGPARRVGGFALPGSGVADMVAPREGVAGQALADGKLLVVEDVPPEALPISTAVGHTRPRTVVAVPVTAEGQPNGVMELVFAGPASPAALQFLERIAEAIGVAARSLHYRERLEALLAETQRQSEELTVQQEELRVVNDELRLHAQRLQDSQARMEEQQAEVEEMNRALEEHTRTLERQRADLECAHTELLEKADQLERSNRYKSEFLANMSHELRTPLKTSMILSRVLAENRQGNLTSDQVRHARMIHGAGNDLLALINDILDLARIEAGKLDVDPQPVDLPRVIETLLRNFQPLAQEKQLVLSAQFGPGIGTDLVTDALRLQQILRNLLSNALKFTERGRVELSVQREGSGWHAFRVTDTGVGIPREQQGVIFEAFRQLPHAGRSVGGTGLGLTIARELAEKLGGSLEVCSVPGEGSTFELRLPLQYPAPATEGAPALAAASRGVARPAPATGASTSVTQARSAVALAESVDDDRGRIRPGERIVLVVEDDARFAQVLLDLAHEMKFQCIIATCASEAIRLAEQYQPGAMLLDINLPDLSGLSVLEQIKRNPATRHLPVHVVSVSDHTRQALEMGAVGYALKPVRREQLVSAFERLERKLDQKIRRVLVVEDDAAQRQAIVELLNGEGVDVTPVDTAEQALQLLSAGSFDSMVLDLKLPDMSGYELLDRMAQDEAYSFPPVIVYTGRALTNDEEQRLRRYATSIVIKGARSPERLLDEVTLFLHQVEAKLRPDQQQMLRDVRHRDALLEGRRILVVEDDVRNVLALTSVLEPKGVQLDVARNGREALEILDRRTNGDTAGIDLVLMDVMMPEMDGLTATREIRKRSEWARLPIITLTAKAMPQDRENCLAAGANDYITKPLDVDRLLSLIRVWMPK